MTTQSQGTEAGRDLEGHAIHDDGGPRQAAASHDIAEILGWPLDEDEGPTDEQRERAADLHRETQTALQVVLQTGSFTPGQYVNADKFAPYGITWQLASTSTEG